MTRRAVLPLLLIAGLVLATASADPAPDERITSRYTGRTYEVHVDPGTGTKTLRGPGGREYADIRAMQEAELVEIGDPKARIDPDLWPAVYGPGNGTTPRELVLVLADQPLQRVSGTPPAGGVENVRAWRRWVVEETSRRAAASREPVLTRLDGLEVVGTSDLLNAIFLVAAPADLPGLLVKNPEIWCVLPAGTRQVRLNASVPTTSAKSFWDGGYTGAGITVGVIDTGMDNQHPALKAAISQEKVYLTWGSQQSNFNDVATSTDDKHGHGTHCGGIVASRDTTYAGVAKGAALVNAKAGYLNTSGLGSLHDYDIFDATHWTSDKVDVLSLSFGGGGGAGTSSLALLYDAAVHGLGIHVAAAAGNSGPNSGTIITPADGFNIVTVGALNDQGTTSLTDDAIASFSSRGATSDGRRKPTLTAPGYNIYSSSHVWETAADFRNGSGTSMACPHMAGALALLMDYNGAWKPQSLKALLVNSARTGTPYPASPDNTWGWGGLDLGRAYTERSGVLEGTLTNTGEASLYFVRTTSLATGDRATLAWNRQIAFPSSGVPGSAPTLLDLDLYLYDGVTGAEHVNSTSTVNSVEQLKTTAAVATPVLRVKRTGTFPTGSGGFSAQPFAVATPIGFTAASPTALTVAVDAPADPIGPGTSFTVTVTVSNTGALPALTPALTLTVPTGFTLTSGSTSTTMATLAGRASRDVTFSLTAPVTSATGSVTGAVTSSGFGITAAAGPVGASVTVDAVAPTGTVLIEGDAPYTNDTAVDVTLTATDAHSGVASMRIARGTDDWDDWQDYDFLIGLILPSGDGTKTVRAQFRDRAGNLSEVVSDSIVLDTVAPSGTVRLDDGAEFTNAATAAAAPTASDALSGVSGVRFRIDDGAWSAWEPVASSRSVPLPGDDGTRTVEMMVLDRAGNLSSIASDTIVVDRTPPTASVAIEEGLRSVNASTVSLGITSADALSGVDAMQVTAGAAGPWEAIAATKTVTLSTGEGARSVRVVVRDRAGNESTVATDSILVDLTPPTGTFRVNDGARYVLPGEALWLDVDAADGALGSGIVSGRVRFDGSWSGPYDLTKGAMIPVRDADRPATGGDLIANLILTDEAGNDSAPIGVNFTAIPPLPGAALRKLSGTIDDSREVESFALHLVHGDTLSVRLKYKALVRGEFADVGLDLVRPDGRRLVLDRYPNSRPKAGIQRYFVPETGRYFLLVYRTGGSETSRWTARVKVKQSRLTKRIKGETEVIEFPAAHGSKLRGTLSAEGITAADVQIVGPEGPVVFEFRERKGRVILRPVILDSGTGTYEIQVESSGPVKHRLTCTRPKP